MKSSHNEYEERGEEEDEECYDDDGNNNNDGREEVGYKKQDVGRMGGGKVGVGRRRCKKDNE